MVRPVYGWSAIMSHPTLSKIGTLPAAALVVASMVGTGVFTSLGYQVGDIPSGPGILLVWALGGLVALCGALSYAELAGALPRSGGEYHFIGKLYHPSLGWTAGLLSAVVGFAAPTALAALALGSYAHRAFPGIPAAVAAVVALVGVTGGHLITLKASARLQTVATGAEAHAGAGVHPRGISQDRARRHPLGNPAAGGLGNHCESGFRGGVVVCFLRLLRLERGGLHAGGNPGREADGVARAGVAGRCW